jgi:hypothetical protein
MNIMAGKFTRRFLCTVAFVFCSNVVLPRANSSPPTEAAIKTQRKPDKAAIVQRLSATCWRETLRDDWGHRSTIPGDLYGWQLLSRNVEIWGYAGEFSPTAYSYEIEIDVEKEPMRLDLLSRGEKGKRDIQPGIFRFEGEQLIWMTPGLPNRWQDSPKSGECELRPRSFEATKENGYVKRVMVPCKLHEQVHAK